MQSLAHHLIPAASLASPRRGFRKIGNRGSVSSPRLEVGGVAARHWFTTDLLQLVNNFTRLVFRTFFGCKEDFQREGPQPFKLAGVGGVSEFFGWTDQQRAWAAKEGWGYRLVFTGRLIGAIVLVDTLYLGAQKLGPLLQEMQAH